MKHLPNILSASRIALCLPLLLADAMTVPFWVLYVIAGTTDMLDGFLARRWGVESKFGARLDSLADFVLVLAVGYKLFPWLKLPTALWMMVGLGANVFADFLASWTDFLGGKSGAYRDVLDELFADVRKQMIDKATDVGANAILGFRLSFNELSGKQKSMLMLSGYGTLALVEPNKFERLEKIQKLKSFLSEGLLTQDEYDEEETKISSMYENFIFDDTTQSIEDFIDMNVSAEQNDSEQIFDNIWKLSVEGIQEAELPFVLKGNTSKEVLGNLLKEERYNEAGKYYMEKSKVDANAAYEFIFNIISQGSQSL